MGEEAPEALVGKVITHAVTSSAARSKGLAQRLRELGFAGMKGETMTQSTISNWRRGRGVPADALLALARDLKLDLNALLYNGVVAPYDAEADVEASVRRLEEARDAAERLLRLLDKRDG